MWTLNKSKKMAFGVLTPPGEWSWQILGSKKMSTFLRKNWVPEWCKSKKIMC